MQSQRFGSMFSYQLLRSVVKMLLFGILCGLIVVSISAQYHDVPDDIVFPGPINSKSRDKPATDYVSGNGAQVIVSTLRSSTELFYRRKEIVPLEEHTACKCDCRIKEKDCNEKQSYQRDKCICVCENVDEAEKCRRNNDTKMWNPDRCVCTCRTILPCNTGYYFDHNTCRCRQITFSRPLNRLSPTKGSNYNFDNTRQPQNVPPVIIPL